MSSDAVARRCGVPAGETLLESLALAQRRSAELVALRGGQAADRVLGLIRLLADGAGCAILPTRLDMATSQPSASKPSRGSSRRSSGSGSCRRSVSPVCTLPAVSGSVARRAVESRFLLQDARIRG